MSKDIETIGDVLDEHAKYYIRKTIEYLKLHSEPPTFVTGENEHDKLSLESIQKIIKRDVIGEDEPGVTNVMIAMEHNHQRQALINALYGKGEDER